MKKGLTPFRGAPLDKPVWNPALNDREVPVRGLRAVVHAVRCLEYWISPRREIRVITGLSIRWTLMLAIPTVTVVVPALMALKVIVGILAVIAATLLTVVTTFASICGALILIWFLLMALGALVKWSLKKKGDSRQRR